MRPLVLPWSVLGLKHYTAGAGVGVMVKSVFVVPQRHKNSKGWEMLQCTLLLKLVSFSHSVLLLGNMQFILNSTSHSNQGG